MTTYYNEIDRFAAAWLRKMIEADLIPFSEVQVFIESYLRQGE